MKKILFVLVLMGIIFSISAAPVNEVTAKTAAANMLLERGSLNSVKWQQSYTIGNELPDFYIFNYDNGYVIVSADDRAVPILAYSFENPYEPQSVPPQMTDWLENWQLQMQEIREKNLSGLENQEKWASLTNENFLPQRNLRDVSPLLTCNWNQDNPWNQHCPYGPGQSNPFVYAGCVATSMAQVMYYWGHPSSGIGSHAYNHDQYGYISCDFENTDFNYDSMYDNSATYEAKELQWAAGVSVEMNYGPSGSGAQVGYGQYSARNSMIAFFDYHPSATFRAKDNYSNDAYENYIRQDLDNGRPLIYSGTTSSYGHAFNLDGYQGTSYFHFNFGWSGSGNGYFYLSNINPMGNSFNQNQGAVFGLYPNEELTPPYDLAAVVLNQNDILLSWEHADLQRSLQGFNVFNNGLLEDTVEPDENSIMINNLDDGIYLLWVTALYITGESAMSEMVTVNIMPPTAPTANAGDDQTVESGQQVFLDASGSHDVNGDILTYEWTAPPEITLQNPTSVSPSFTAPQVNDQSQLVFSLIVSDGTFFSEPDEVVVTVLATDAQDNSIYANPVILNGNYPNPFNPQTDISFSLINSALVNLDVYNLQGKKIKTLADSRFNAGQHSITWFGDDEQGREVPSGIYFYKINSDDYSASGKMILMK